MVYVIFFYFEFQVPKKKPCEIILEFIQATFLQIKRQFS